MLPAHQDLAHPFPVAPPPTQGGPLSLFLLPSPCRGINKKHPFPCPTPPTARPSPTTWTSPTRRAPTCSTSWPSTPRSPPSRSSCARWPPHQARRQGGPAPSAPAPGEPAPGPAIPRCLGPWATLAVSPRTVSPGAVPERWVLEARRHILAILLGPHPSLRPPSTTCVSCCLVSRPATTPSPHPPRWGLRGPARREDSVGSSRALGPWAAAPALPHVRGHFAQDSWAVYPEGWTVDRTCPPALVPRASQAGCQERAVSRDPVERGWVAGGKGPGHIRSPCTPPGPPQLRAHLRRGRGVRNQDGPHQQGRGHTSWLRAKEPASGAAAGPWCPCTCRPVPCLPFKATAPVIMVGPGTGVPPS